MVDDLKFDEDTYGFFEPRHRRSGSSSDTDRTGQNSIKYFNDGSVGVGKNGYGHLDNEKETGFDKYQKMMKIRTEENILTFQQLGKLGQERDMHIIQTNGQRQYGPPRDTSIPPPGKGCEIFVGRLPRVFDESNLVPIFEQVGKIYEMRLMMDFSGTNRGYCFVQYYTPSDVTKAIQMLNNLELIPGHRIGVVESVDNCRLYIGGIQTDKSESEIIDEIRKIVDGVEKIFVPRPRYEDGCKNRGFVFVEFQNHRAAAMARRKLLAGMITMFGVEIRVDWAAPISAEKVTKKAVKAYSRIDCWRY